MWLFLVDLVKSDSDSDSLPDLCDTQLATKGNHSKISGSSKLVLTSPSRAASDDKNEPSSVPAESVLTSNAEVLSVRQMPKVSACLCFWSTRLLCRQGHKY